MEKSTTLTPSMERMFSSRTVDSYARSAHSEEKGLGLGAPSSASSSHRGCARRGGGTSGGAEDLRHMVENCLSNGISGTACVLADRLLRLADSTAADIVLFARCFQAKGEPRRCLAALEHKGLLAAEAMTALTAALSPRGANASPGGMVSAMGSTGGSTGSVMFSSSSSSSSGSPMSAALYPHLQAVHLAAQCLLELEQWDDCVHLLEPLLLAADGSTGAGNRNRDGNGVDMEDDGLVDAALKRARRVSSGCSSGGGSSGGGSSSGGGGVINIMSSVYSLAGRCHDLLENKPRAALCLILALRIDPACAEAAEYLVDNGLISGPERRRVFAQMDLRHSGREWLELYYRFVLLGEVSAATEQDLLGLGGPAGSAAPNSTGADDDSMGGPAEEDSYPAVGPTEGPTEGPTGTPAEEDSYPAGQPRLSGRGRGIDVRLSSLVLVKRAEQLFDNQYPAAAYRLARQAYVLDPFDSKGLLVYVAAMVELQLTTELFYLGHELSKTYVPLSLSLSLSISLSLPRTLT